MLPPAPQQTQDDFWLFVLGREPLLSAAEIRAVFEREKNEIFNWQIKNDKFLIFRPAKKFDAKILMAGLGGTIKIARLIKIKNTPEDIADFLTNHLPEGKINFSVSGNIRANYGLEIKKILKNLNRSARYVEIKNTATLLYNNLVDKGADITIIDGEIFVSEAIQPFEEMGERDFGRPGRDDLSGMLPPKLAMMMINLSGAKKDSVLFDPFCGSGTIITEAMLMGYTTLIGADISEKAVSDTKKNIDWTLKKIKDRDKSYDIKILNIDITNPDKQLANQLIDNIVTEPYLGKPLKGRETADELNAQKNTLQQLYLKAFEQFAKILKPDGAVLFIFPKFSHAGKWISSECTAELKKLGFEEIEMLPGHKSLTYRRPDQKVAREIVKFKYH